MAAFTIVPRHVIGGKGHVAPSDKLRIAGIGAGGKGESDIAEFAKSKHATAYGVHLLTKFIENLAL